MSKARVMAFLGMDIGLFRSGLDKANGLFAGFKRGLKIGGLGGLGGFLGAGAILMGFKSMLDAAQDVRDEAKELGMELDRGVASVAAYADRWDQIKEAIRDAGIEALSFFTRTGRAIGQQFGTGSSDEEVTALKRTEEIQKQTEKDLKANGERIRREMESATERRDEAMRTARLAGMSDKEREVALEEELGELFEKRAGLQTGSLAAIKVETELAERQTELARIRDQLKRKEQSAPSDFKSQSTFGMTVTEVAKQRPVGRRSERERLAGEVVALEERGKAAEASGRFDLAKSYRDRAAARARSIGFGDTETSAKMLTGGAAAAAAAVAPGSWDARHAAQLAARNASLTAKYGVDYKRPDSFEQARPKEESADKLLEAASALSQAATDMVSAIENAEVTVDG